MLPDVTDSKLDQIALMAEDGPIEALKSLRHVYIAKARAHTRYARIYQVVYYVMGGVAVSVAVVIGSVDGCEHPDAVVAMSLTVALLTSVLNFFGIERRLERHDSSKGQYEALEADVEKFLLTSHRSAEAAERLERSCFDRGKLIASQEPDFSLCCLKTG